MKFVKTEQLTFGINEEGNRVLWLAEGTPMKASENGDFWRMYLDDFKWRDCPVHSAKQRGTVCETEKGLKICYDSLLDDKGRTADVTLTIQVTADKGALKFDARLENRDSRFRLNEFKLPFMDMESLCGNRGQDVLLRPLGFGEKVFNPWDMAKTTSRRSSEQRYCEPQQFEFFRRGAYPGFISMGWMGVETNGNFLYLGQHDELFRTCDLTYGVHTDRLTPSLMLEITHFPVVKCGETEDIAPTYVALFKGDWRQGSAFYRGWADETWWTDPKTPSWLKNMTGRQRVILRHGNGEILHTYDEVPRIMAKALECGIPLLELYGWHSGGQDNDYPNYVADPEQGGEEGLRRAIEEVRKMGGHISLYGQGELLDTWNDYFKETGHKVCRKNILGDPYYQYFHYSSGGSLMRRHNCNITHTTACQAAREWQELVCDETEKFLDKGATGVFWDMLGGCTPVVCFDESHQHGSRGDREAVWRSENVKNIHDICLKRDCSFGIEHTIDFLSKDADYTMSCWQPAEHTFFEMFRHTFPEIVSTSRWCDDENPCYISALNEDFIYSLRFNISMFRDRGTLYDVPNYAEYLKKLTDLQLQYAEYLLRGKFCCETSLTLPDCVKYTEYKSEKDDNRRLFALWNRGVDFISFDVMGQQVKMSPNSVTCVEWNK